VLFLFTSIILSYFDLRTINLLLYSVFLAANLAFSWLSLQWGFPFYGYGYFMAALLAFVLAFLVTVYFLKDLPIFPITPSSADTRSRNLFEQETGDRRLKKEERRKKKEERRKKKEERRKKEEGRRKKEEGRRKGAEGHSAERNSRARET